MIPIRASSRVLAVIGHPVGHSQSPSMFNAALGALGIEAVYVALDVPPDALASAMDTFRAVGVCGNVTVPHKVAAAALVDRRTDIARDLGAINTFWREDGELVGDNTDVGGVGDVLDGLEAEGPWLILGTGGSARAVVAAARERGLPVVVRSREASRARSFVEWALSVGGEAALDEGEGVGTVINTTPLGLGREDAFPVEDDRIDGVRAALDLTYRRGGSRWIAHLTECGIRGADGRRVLVAQGVRAFRRFFPDMVPPEPVMTMAVERGLAGS